MNFIFPSSRSLRDISRLFLQFSFGDKTMAARARDGKVKP